jgi:hypothetical protein
MSAPDDLEREAYAHLDEGRFAEAREAYRRAFLAKTPTSSMLFNLPVAEDRERIAFAHVVAQQYPTNMRCRLAEARTMFVCQTYQWAVRLCTDLLQLTELPKEQLEVRSLRFRAAARCRRPPGEFLEDFAAIWRMGEHHDVARLYRGTLLEEIAGLTNCEALPMLEELEKGQWNAAGVAELIRAKITELRLLAGAVEGLELRQLGAKLRRESKKRRERNQDGEEKDESRQGH